MRKRSVFLVTCAIIALALIAVCLATAPKASAVKDVVVPVESGVDAMLHRAAWHPNGTYALIVGDDGTVLRYDGTSGAVTALSSGVTSDLYGVSWKPDGSYALIAGQNYTLLSYDGSTFTNVGNTLNIQSTLLENSYDVRWAPDGSYALVSGLSGILLKYNETNLTKIANDNGGLETKFNSNGVALVVGEDCGVVLTYNGTTLSYYNLSDDLTNSNWAQGAAWSPSGDHALIVGLDGLAATFNGTAFTAVETGVQNHIYADEWAPSGAYALAVGRDGLLLKQCNGEFWNVGGDSRDCLFGLAWKPGASEALIVGYYNSTTVHGLIWKFSWNASAEPDISATALIMNATAAANESITMSFDVTNVDVFRGENLGVDYYLNSTLIDSDTFALGAEEIRTVNTTWYANFTAGSYVFKAVIKNSTMPILNLTKNITISAAPAVNHAPVIATIAAQTGTAGTVFTYQVNATDADGDALTYYASSGAINATSGLFSYTPTVAGTLNITITVNDTHTQTAAVLALTVSAAPAVNHAPVIATIAAQTVTLGNAFTYQISATDADGDNLTYATDKGTINVATGFLNYTPALAVPTTINVTVSDGTNTTVVAITLNVYATNMPVVDNKTTGSFIPGFELAYLIPAFAMMILFIRRKRHRGF